MVIGAPAECPPHHWFQPVGKDGITLARCMKCQTSQFQPTYLPKDIKIAKAMLIKINLLNQQHGYPVIQIKGKWIREGKL